MGGSLIGRKPNLTIAGLTKRLLHKPQVYLQSVQEPGALSGAMSVTSSELKVDLFSSCVQNKSAQM